MSMIPTAKALPAGWRTITSAYHPTDESEALMKCALNCIADGQATPETVMIVQLSSSRAYVALRGPEPVKVEGASPRYENLPRKEKLHDAIRRLKLTQQFKRVATAHATEDEIWAWVMNQPGLCHFHRPGSLRWTRNVLGCTSAHGGHRATKKKPVAVLNLSHR